MKQLYEISNWSSLNNIRLKTICYNANQNQQITEYTESNRTDSHHNVEDKEAIHPRSETKIKLNRAQKDIKGYTQEATKMKLSTKEIQADHKQAET